MLCSIEIEARFISENNDNRGAIDDFLAWIKLNLGTDIEVLLNRLEKYTQECGIELPEHIKARLR